MDFKEVVQGPTKTYLHEKHYLKLSTGEELMIRVSGDKDRFLIRSVSILMDCEGFLGETTKKLVPIKQIILCNTSETFFDTSLASNNGIIESLAKYAHDAWSGWMKYLFRKSKTNIDGTVTIPKWAVDRWARQMNTHYEDLSEEEKNSDRSEAQDIINAVEK